MPRRRVAERRAVLPVPVYTSPLVTKFINGIMWGGKRSKLKACPTAISRGSQARRISSGKFNGV
jgi:small subunit ribosomal protein S7